LNVGAGEILHLVKPVELLFFRMKAIKASLVLNEQVDDNTCSETYRQAENIDEGVQRALPDIAKSDSEVVFNHAEMELAGVLREMQQGYKVPRLFRGSA
jgi:hypothetical protein